MNPKLYEEPPHDIFCPECPACGADPRLMRREVDAGKGGLGKKLRKTVLLHRITCARCRTKTAEFSTWVGAVAAWDRREVSPRCGGPLAP